MTEDPSRPDPDRLLRRVQLEEARAKRGSLKIFFGFAPGVGKTYRMLQVAHELAAQKHDVVIGVVEDHRRADTASVVVGLEQLPRRQVEYRGKIIEEFDLDRALARKPAVLLVDELAHTNAPGSRHVKRWQDIEELRDAGIDVLTTINVQHIESLNDIVAQITHVQVRETVPDSVLDNADAIELIDLAPDELLERLKEGKIYAGDQADRATAHFFQRGNLLALRELALRRTAQCADEDVREYREEQNLVSTWAAGNRVLVCVGHAPSSGRLVRSAARMAAALRCPWVACYVEIPIIAELRVKEREQLEVHVRLAESLGATIVRLTGRRISEALLEYAQKHNVTDIVIGKPTHSRWRDQFYGSLVDEVIRGSLDIDVHVIRGQGTVTVNPTTTASPRAFAMDYAWAALFVGATLGLAVLLRSAMNLPDLGMLFLLPVMVTAVWFRRGPALFAAALGVASYDFFLIEPLYTFSVTDRHYFLTFAMMFGVGYAVSELTGRLRRQQRNSVLREQQTAVLYAIAKELGQTDSLNEIAVIAARYAHYVFASDAIVLGFQSGALKLLEGCPDNSLFDISDKAVAQWSFEHRALAGLGTNTLPGAKTLAAPLSVRQGSVGVLVLRPKESRPLQSAQRAFLDVFCRHIATAFERVGVAPKT